MVDERDNRSAGLPGDYTDALHRVYFEVGEHEGFVKDVITQFLFSRVECEAALQRSLPMHTETASGYEVVLPVQLIPELVRELVERNVAVFQVIHRGSAT